MNNNNKTDKFVNLYIEPNILIIILFYNFLNKWAQNVSQPLSNVAKFYWWL